MPVRVGINGFGRIGRNMFRAAKARGEAAPIIENGKAVAEALSLVSHEWAAAGDAGREVYLLQKLRALVAVAAARVAKADRRADV